MQPNAQPVVDQYTLPHLLAGMAIGAAGFIPQ